jgi:hypothetical protein
VATDPAGNIYLVCESTENWLGPGNIPPLHAPSGSTDVVIVKLDRYGNYQWHTFYGSTNGDSAKGIAVDGYGNVYVAGFSMASWNGPQNGLPLHAFYDFWDLFILKLDTNGSYQWHTFYGAGTQMGFGITLDDLGGVYVVGQSFATWLGDGDTEPLHSFVPGISDLVVLKLNTDGVYQWHTFYGCDGQDVAWEVVADSVGNVYLAGSSPGTWNGNGDTSPVHAYSGDSDMVIMKLTSSGAYA